jgi:uncharacterized protein YneF (UPF0154 family)
MTRTRLILAIILAFVIGLLLGPCFITSNPDEPSHEPEPPAADETGVP